MNFILNVFRNVSVSEVLIPDEGDTTFPPESMRDQYRSHCHQNHSARFLSRRMSNNYSSYAEDFERQTISSHWWSRQYLYIQQENDRPLKPRPFLHLCKKAHPIPMCLKSLCACLLNSGVQEQASSPSCIPSLLLWLRNRLAPALVWREAPTANPAWQMVLGVIQTLPITPLTFLCSSSGFTPVCLPGTWGWFCLGRGGLVFVYLFISIRDMFVLWI